MNKDIKRMIETWPLDVSKDPIIIKTLPEGYNLAAPESYWAATPEMKSIAVDGCGPANLDWVIPDKILGLNIKPACQVHDWMCTMYNDEAGFKISTQVFLDNMMRLNKAKTKCQFLSRLRRWWIMRYYRVVRDYGRLFYYDSHLDMMEQAVSYL